MKPIVILLTGLLATGAATAVAQESAPVREPRLLRARFEVTPDGPARARVTAALEVDSAGELDLVVVWFAGQRLDRLLVRDAEGPVAAALTHGPGSAGRIVVPAGSGDRRSLYLDYLVEVPPGRRFRYPLPVPEAPVTSGSEAVVEILLPAGAAYRGDGFPALVASGERDGHTLLRTRGAGVPGFVHVVHGEEARWPTVPTRIELAALLAVLLPLAALGLRAARRRAGEARP